MITTIGRGITIKGTIHAQEPVRILGTVTGDVLASDHDVTVEPGGQVEGGITGRRITIGGRCRGRLIARQAVRIRRTAVVKSAVASPKISIEDRATFNGSVEPARVDAAIRVQAYRNHRAGHAATVLSG